MGSFLILGRKHAFVALLFFLSGAGCSFHSNQFEVLKTILRKDSGPEPQWVFSWGDVTEKVFAVNAGSSIFFANSGGTLVHFNGAFVEKIEGIRLNPRATMDISITKTKLDELEVFNYGGLKSDLGDLLCEPPSETANELALEFGSMSIIEITQKCFVEDRVVKQNIILNQTRQLIGLKFFVHPARQPVTIRYGGIKELSTYL